jgi:predicted peptidase
MMMRSILFLNLILFSGPLRAEDLLRETTLTIPADAAPATANHTALLFVPTKPTTEKLPLVIYLHGAGSKGEDHIKPKTEPLAKWLRTDDVQRQYPCFVLIPQCAAGEDPTGLPRNWTNWENQRGAKSTEWKVSLPEPSDQLQGAMALLRETLKNDRIDPQRIYLTGMSMGGSGSLNWASREPERFAAIVSVCGLSDAARAAPLAKTPLWILHGAKDDQVPIERSRVFVERLKKHDSPVKFTEFPDGGHSIATQVMKEPGLLEWLFAQKCDTQK